jgi:hypothetical protein
MFASACSITARFFLFFSLEGSTVFLEKDASLGGTSGGLGALGDLLPTDASFPVKNRLAACRVRSTWLPVLLVFRKVQEERYKQTFNIGLGVLRMRTAHCMRVVGGLFVGTIGSSSCGSSVCKT